MATPERRPAHPDVAALAVGGLDDDAALRAAGEVAASPAAARELVELRGLDALLRDMAPDLQPPPELRERTLGALRAARAEGANGASAPQPAGAPEPRSAPRRRRWTRPRVAFAGAAAGLAVGAAAVALLLGGADEAREAPAPGPPPQVAERTLEIEALLRGPEDRSIVAHADVFMQAFGRTIELDSDTLPVLPRGQFYELWFVGPGDEPGSPNRISAGTWHPDEAGRTAVSFHAAVDPALFGVIEVTREPGDGDPAPSTPVLRWRAPSA